MFSLFKKKSPIGSSIEFTIIGMHCTSCSMSIDGALEDLNGVYESSTNYAKAHTRVLYDPAVVTVEKMKEEIKKLGYGVKEMIPK